MKHNYDAAHNRANGARNRYNSAKSRAAKLQAWKASTSGLGNLKKAADSATHNERQWKIRYD